MNTGPLSENWDVYPARRRLSLRWPPTTVIFTIVTGNIEAFCAGGSVAHHASWAVIATQLCLCTLLAALTIHGYRVFGQVIRVEERLKHSAGVDYM